MELLKLIALGVGVLSVFGARAELITATHQPLVCNVTMGGIPSEMKDAKSELYWESGDDPAYVILAQPDLQRNVVRLTFVERLATEPKALLFSAARGQTLTDAERELVRTALSERSTQIVAPIAHDRTLTVEPEIFGQHLAISCLPK